MAFSDRRDITMIKKTYHLQLDLTGTQFQDYNRSSLLFFDIETTGLTARMSYIYLIGAIAWEDNSWKCTQWFAQNTIEELDILKEFLAYTQDKTLLIHFNGDRFDIPYINEKCETYHLDTTLSSIISRDLLRMIRPLRKMLQLTSLKQKSLESFLHVDRDDEYSGGELIQVYQRYQRTPNETDLKLLLLHNYEDLLGMIAILPILSYQTILNKIYHITSYEVNGDSLDVQARLPVLLPRPFSYIGELYSIHAEKDQMKIMVPGTREPLKYFFADYKNYYYLPEEDMALHKSVAAFVDKDHREPARASTCYSRKKGFYLPQNDKLFTPVFKTDYYNRQLYFSCNEAFLADPDNITNYIHHLLSDL